LILNSVPTSPEMVVAGTSNRHIVSLIVADGFIAFFCILGLVHIMQKAGLPIGFDERAGEVICTEVFDPTLGSFFSSGDVLISIDGISLRKMEDVEFLLDGRRVGESVMFEVEGSSGRRTFSVSLRSFYGVEYLVTATIVGGLFLLVGFIVFAFRPDDSAAKIFHWGSAAAAVMMLATWGRYNIEPAGLGLTLRALFFLAHGFVAVLFFHFTLIFPRMKWPAVRKLVPVFYALGAVLTIWPTVTFVQAATSMSMDIFHDFLTAFFTARWSLVVFGFASLASMVHSYVVAREEAERRKLRWILWGLLVGFPPYVVLWVIPQIVLKHGLVPEEIVMVMSGLIPMAFGVSILKYRVMDIDLIINRSLVYGLVMIAALSVYAGIVGLATVFVMTWTAAESFVVSAFAAVVVALLFDPVRSRIQRFVDKRFFRVRYDFREAQRRLVDEIKGSLDIRHLAGLVVQRVDELFSPERVGFFRTANGHRRLHLVAHRHFDMLEVHSVRFDPKNLEVDFRLPVALRDRVEPAAAIDVGDESVFRRWGMVLVLGMMSEDRDILGILVLGNKRSGTRYSVEDLDLLRTVTTQAGLAIERITLQQKLILEHEETKRLEELNRLKSYFVSGVSHDLKTPLTSIKVFAEMLRSSKKTSPRRLREYLQIIEGESDRLTRLINNVLDFSRIERGAMEYRFADVRLNELVRSIMRTMTYQITMQGFKVRTHLAKKELPIHADADAVAEALINILSNAIKYSAEKKPVTVSTFRRDGFAGVRIDDKGIGIPQEELEKIFDAFYRARGEKAQQAGGLGLGLALVKHIVESHGGRIDVESTPGKGSSFTLLFPMRRGYDGSGSEGQSQT
jgi:signal transduction histidine kinase